MPVSIPNSSPVRRVKPGFRRLAAVVWRLMFAGLLACQIGCDSGTPDSLQKNALRKTPESSVRLAHLFDLENRNVDPFEATNSSAIVLIFIRSDCPISNRYAPEIRRLQEQFRALGAAFWLVYPDSDVTPEEIRSHLLEYQLQCNVVRDPKQELVRLCQARVTPEAAVFVPGRKLVYHGRIDDRFVAFGSERKEPTQHELQDVLAAVTSGQPVTTIHAAAVGCTISVKR
jgi:hypothetical protein